MKKLNRASSLFLFVFAAPVFYSCAPGIYPGDPYIVQETRQKENVYYAPATQNVPLLSEKEDLSFSMALGYTTKHSGVDVQAAFVPAKNLGLLAGFCNYSQKEESQNGKISSYELGGGYVRDFKNFHFEVYGGFGGGSTKNYHHTGESKVKFSKFFIQPTLAIQSPGKTVQFAFVSKFSHNHFNVTDTSFVGEREPFVASQFKIMSDNPNRIFWEPGIVLRTGWKNVAFNIGVSVIEDFSQQKFAMDKVNYFFGLVFRGNVREKKSSIN